MLGALLASWPAAALDRGVSCHIHPPGSTPSEPFGLIGPFDSPSDCERARQERMGSAGRCHCAADFSPGWLPDPARPGPGLSPLG